MDKRGKDWTSLTDEQENTLVDLAVDQLGQEFSKSKFVDCVHSLLDSIAGFEVASQSRRRSLTDKLWRRAMFLRRQEKADERVVSQEISGSYMDTPVIASSDERRSAVIYPASYWVIT